MGSLIDAISDHFPTNDDVSDVIECQCGWFYTTNDYITHAASEILAALRRRYELVQIGGDGFDQRVQAARGPLPVRCELTAGDVQYFTADYARGLAAALLGALRTAECEAAG